MASARSLVRHHLGTGSVIKLQSLRRTACTLIVVGASASGGDNPAQMEGRGLASGAAVRALVASPIRVDFPDTRLKDGVIDGDPYQGDRFRRPCRPSVGRAVSIRGCLSSRVLGVEKQGRRPRKLICRFWYSARRVHRRRHRILVDSVESPRRRDECDPPRPDRSFEAFAGV